MGGRRQADDGHAAAVPRIGGRCRTTVQQQPKNQSTVKGVLTHRLPRPVAHQQPKAETREFGVLTAGATARALSEQYRQCNASAAICARLSHPRSMWSAPPATHLMLRAQASQTGRCNGPVTVVDCRPTLRDSHKQKRLPTIVLRGPFSLCRPRRRRGARGPRRPRLSASTANP